jgi:hypothetical protein
MFLPALPHDPAASDKLAAEYLDGPHFGSTLREAALR